MKIPRNISSELPRIGPTENPSKYPEKVLPRYITRTFPTNWWFSEFPRKFISSEFRRKFPRDFRGKMNFQGVISEDLFRRTTQDIPINKFRQEDESALLVRALGVNCHASGFDASRRRTVHPCHEAGIGPSGSGHTLPGEAGPLPHRAQEMIREAENLEYL
ncbi:hypothetical protein F2Q69_00014395 [Brassica cretica]|uniref:Uncharacterized protein n=1 Tax=Brassica cretica TaxID=69181 RepID=A0A8S9R8J6_BRACR|nr:hypothetical protein F2Q69_00014395 [Brassica cretica]